MISNDSKTSDPSSSHDSHSEVPSIVRRAITSCRGLWSIVRRAITSCSGLWSSFLVCSWFIFFGCRYTCLKLNRRKLKSFERCACYNIYSNGNALSLYVLVQAKLILTHCSLFSGVTSPIFPNTSQVLSSVQSSNFCFRQLLLNHWPMFVCSLSFKLAYFNEKRSQ